VNGSIINSRDPERTALITEAGRAISYRDLLNDISRVSTYLKPHDLLFIVGHNDYPTLLFYLASLECGTVPLILSADMQADQIKRLIDVFSPHLIISESKFADTQNGLSALGTEEDYTLYRNEASSNPQLHPDLAFLAATSGSTGSPKLVRLSIKNLTANAASISEYLNITPSDRAMAFLPINYSYGFSVVNSHLFSGASFVLSNKSLMEPAFWQQARDNEATSFSGVPFHYKMLLRLRLERLKVPSLKKMTQAGGRLEPENIAKVHEACENNDIQFWTMYGQTEASPRISYLPSEDTLRKLGSIGRAIPGGRLWVNDDDGNDITATNQVGELIYEGPNVCLGYAESAEELALGDINQGILHTGDLARRDDEGYFYIEGRLHRFLKVYGNRISLDQIERCMTDKGLECAAHGCDDHLIVQIVDTQDLDTDALRRELAAFAGINFAAISVAIISEIPHLPTGKVDYQCLNQNFPQQ
jgi:long-chain acyl-CoA synthetase